MTTVVALVEAGVDEYYEEFERLQSYLESLKLQNTSLVERLAAEVKKVDVFQSELLPGKRRSDEEDDASKRTRTRERDTEYVDGAYDDDDDDCESDGDDDDEEDVNIVTQHHDFRTMNVVAGGASACPSVKKMQSSSSTVSTSLTMSAGSLPAADLMDDDLSHGSKYRSAGLAADDAMDAAEFDGECVLADEIEDTAGGPVTYRSCIAADGAFVDEEDLLAAAAAALPESERSSFYGASARSSYQAGLSEDDHDDDAEPLYRGSAPVHVAAVQSGAAAPPAAKAKAKKGGSRKAKQAASAAPKQAGASSRPAFDLDLLRELVSAVGALVVVQGDATREAPTDGEVEHALDRLQLLSVGSS